MFHLQWSDLAGGPQVMSVLCVLIKAMKVLAQTADTCIDMEKGRCALLKAGKIM